MFKKIFFWVAILLVGCSKDDKPEILPTDSEQVKMIKQADSFLSLFEEKLTIDLETNDSCLIGDIDKIIITPERNHIIVFDRRNNFVFVFNKEGKFLNKIGREGQAPYEFIQLQDINYFNGVVYLSDQIGKLLKYNINGEYIETVSLINKDMQFNINKMVPFQDSLYAFSKNYQANRSNDKKRYRVLKFENNLPIKGFGIGIGEHESTFFSAGGITYFNNYVLYAGSVDGKIYKIDENDKEELFCDLGELYDLSEYSRLDHSQQMDYMKKNFENYDAILDLNVIGDFLIVSRLKHAKYKYFHFSIIDNEGNIIRKELPFFSSIFESGSFLSEDKEIYLEYNNKEFIYNKGIIKTSLKKSKNHSINNPTLRFYEMKEK